MPVSKVMYALLSTGMKVRLWALSGCWDYDCCWINFVLCSLGRPRWSSLLCQRRTFIWIFLAFAVDLCCFCLFFFVRSYFYICTVISPTAAAAADDADDESSLFNATLPNKKIPKCIYSGHVDQKVRHFWMMQFNSFEVLSSQEAVWVCVYLLIRSIVLRHSAVPIKLFPSVALSGSWERESVCKLSCI